MASQPIVQARYAALVLPLVLDAFPNGYLKHLPRYNGETGPSVEDHLQAFLDFADNMNIEQENVYMRLFVQSIEVYVRTWFRQLLANSIRNWEYLTNIFKNQWGVKKDALYFLTEFEELKRNFGELVYDFNKRFNKLYHKMPLDCKPLVATTKSRFSKAFEDEFSVMLRERTSRTLEDMKTNAIKVEENRAALATLKIKEEKAQIKLKSSQEASTSSKTKIEDSKIDEITSLLRNLSNRISKIETQPRIVQKRSHDPK